MPTTSDDLSGPVAKANYKQLPEKKSQDSLHSLSEENPEKSNKLIGAPYSVFINKWQHL